MGDRVMEPQALLPKSPTGIKGFDEITGGGLPSGRPTLVCGGPGCGKTLFATEFLVRGALEHGEPGVFVSFEERPGDLIQNALPLGWDLRRMLESGQLFLEYVKIDQYEAEETGDFDLGGLFIRLEAAVRAVGARRIVLDTVEALFSVLPNEAILRGELRRLFEWIKDQGLTAVVTAERGEKALTRRGIEEYVSDCVIDLNTRTRDDVTTRRLRVVKYRGSSHGTNEYPFLIDHEGFTLMPITAIGLGHVASEERVSSGIPRLDTMLGGLGYYKGSSVLVSGMAGTGKSSLAAWFAQSICASGGRCLYCSFEESASQIVRNMRSIGLDLGPWVDRGLLGLRTLRATACGLETHLLSLFKAVEEFAPQAVILDPVSNLTAVGDPGQVKLILSQLLDSLKGRGITVLFTDLYSEHSMTGLGEVAISSLMDTWLLLRNIEAGGERNRALFVIKSRGMPHSNQIREFILTSQGVELADVYLGQDTVLMGSARAAQKAREAALAEQREKEQGLKSRALEARRAALQSKMRELEQELALLGEEMSVAQADGEAWEQSRTRGRQEMARLRKAD